MTNSPCFHSIAGRKMLYGNPVLYHMSVRCPHETRPKLIEQEKGMASYPDWIAHTARDGVSMVAAAEGKGITSTCSRSSGRRTERDILACRGDQGRRRRARRSCSRRGVRSRACSRTTRHQCLLLGSLLPVPIATNTGLILH